MSFELNDLVPGFVEDCREHLDHIESSLMDMEAAGENQDPELVNSVFRAAHSIKGGAGMLGLDNIKALAHKLENVLHMVRAGELPASHEVVGVLLTGFDRLTELVGNVPQSESMSIDAQVARLEALAGGGAGKPAGPEEISVGKAGIFVIDPVSLDQARKGGYDIYLLEFDLIHDIHGRNTLPLEVMRLLSDTGRIVDCKLDFEAVGGLDEFENRIPFYVLFATILEQKYVASLVKLPQERVRGMAEAGDAVEVRQADCWCESFGSVALQVDKGAGRVTLPRDMTGRALEHLKAALLVALTRCGSVDLAMAEGLRFDVLFLQLLCAAQAGFVAQGKTLRCPGGLPQELRHSATLAGFGCAEVSGCLYR